MLGYLKGKQSMKVSCVVVMSVFALGLGTGQVWATGQEAQVSLPEGAVIGWVNVPEIAAVSASGQELAGQVQTLNEEKISEINAMNTELQASQEKLEQGASVLSETAAGQLQRDIGRLQIDIQRATEDAQVEVQTLTEELQIDFQDSLIPIIGEIAAEKQLHLVFSVTDSGVVWTLPGLNITADVIARFDAAHAASGGDDQP
ncbi:MAG: OmpH family outer membrane protein [Acidobacteriota bacterium]|nr:OmpH family outer membrane protein [Acidobacteriota bacterium]